MIKVYYNLLIKLSSAVVGLVALFHSKIKLGVQGRKETFSILSKNISSTDRVIWMHVASLGEFEQGRPVLESLRSDYQDHLILLSFFSPSGYEIRKYYENVDVVCYLPLDTNRNAQRFLELAHPELVIFVKYEFWPNFLNQIKQSSAKSILISTVIQSSNKLLKYHRSWFAEMMSTFDVILTQDQQTADLLDNLNISSKISVAGDTRIDRTLAIAAQAEEIVAISEFCKDANILVAGSTWTPDEIHLQELYESDHFVNWKLIIAPHDIGQSHISDIEQRFDNTIRYSQIDRLEDQRVLIIDNIGLLNRLYQYGYLAYIGGGFGTGIHNILEPAAFGLPIIFGPKYQKFVEARKLVNTNGAFVIENDIDLIERFQELEDEKAYHQACESVKAFMEDNHGATEIVMEVINELLQRG